MEFKTKGDLKEAIKKSITTNDERAIKAMLRIYEKQTESEKVSATTSSLNGVGFTGNDAEILTSFCNQYLQRGFLSAKQMVLLKKKIGKYAGQLTRLAIENGLYVKRNGAWVVAEKKEHKRVELQPITFDELNELVNKFKEGKL